MRHSAAVAVETLHIQHRGGRRDRIERRRKLGGRGQATENGPAFRGCFVCAQRSAGPLGTAAAHLIPPRAKELQPERLQLVPPPVHLAHVAVQPALDLVRHWNARRRAASLGRHGIIRHLPGDRRILAGYPAARRSLHRELDLQFEPGWRQREAIANSCSTRLRTGHLRDHWTSVPSGWMWYPSMT